MRHRQIAFACVVLLAAGVLGLAQPPGFPQVYVVNYEIVGQGTITVSPASDDGRTVFTTNTSNVTYTTGSGQDLTLTLTAAPASGWAFARWELGPASGPFTTVTANPTTFKLLAAAGSPSFWTVRAVFLPTYTIMATAGPGGTISPSGTVTVVHGGSQTFTIAPNPGFAIADVLVDGTSVGPVATYTFTNVTANRTIHATFAQITYTITATAGPGGTISPSGTVTVVHGGSQAFTIAPNPGFAIADVLVDGASVGPVATYTFTNVTANHTIHANFVSLFDQFFEDFEDIAGWTRTGLWHIRSVPECVECGELADKFAYYARSTACDYNTGRRTTGILTSPVINLPANLPQITVSFDLFREVEPPTLRPGTFDRTYVQVRFMVGRYWRSWTTMWTKSSRDASPECGSFSRVVNVPRGATRMQIRFVFDSVDARNNAYAGWAVDNVGVRAGALAGASALEPLDVELEAAEPEPVVLEVLPYPNPVRDVHTTVFRVMGVEAEALKVEIYDLTGRLVWKAEAPGNELIWHTQDLTGLPLANGVYLYIAYVRVGGSWVATEVQKVVILR